MALSAGSRLSLACGLSLASLAFAGPRVVTAEPAHPTAAGVSGTDLFRGQLRSASPNADRFLERAAPEHGPVAASNKPEHTPGVARPGSLEQFWAWDFATSSYYRVDAELRYEGDGAWLYLESGADISQAELDSLAGSFEGQILPRVRDAFGAEDSPGIDGVHPLTLLLLDVRDPYAHGGTPYVSGYFLPVNEYRQIDLDSALPGHRSNEREMLYLGIAPTAPSGSVIRQTMAHELQHLIAWDRDRNEEPWLDEGMSELAVLAAGLGHPEAHVRSFVAAQSTALTSWQGTPADYGRVYLFLLYLWERERLDTDWPRALVADPANGLDALATAVGGIEQLRASYADFAVALYHDDPDLDDGRFGFRTIDFGGGSPGSFGMPSSLLLDRTVAGNFAAMAIAATVEPWTFSAYRTESRAAGFEAAITASRDACLTLSTRWLWTPDRPGSLERRCAGAGQTAVFSVPPSTRGPLAAVAHVVVANAGDEAIELTIESGTVTSETSPRIVYVPLSLSR
jgi:hypothetical protein